MIPETIYLDNNASTPIDPRVLDVLNAANSTLYGNPSNSSHPYGKLARDSINSARSHIRKLLHAEKFQIIFTSGATEALNLALQGLTLTKVIVGATEHKAALSTCRWLAKTNNTIINKFPVDSTGVADVGWIDAAVKSRPSLVVAMLANNETGVIHPIRELGILASGQGVPLLCDVTQAIGKIPVSLDALGIDIAVLSGHKIYGPKGVGALLYRENSFSGKLRPILHGGGQEFGLRSGTENAPSILGFAKALEIAVNEQASDAIMIKEMRDKFELFLTQKISNVIINGQQADRLSNTSNFSFSYPAIEDILNRLTNIAISTGSACTTQERAGSYVLKAMGISDELAFNSLRVSFGRFNKPTDAQTAAESISRAICEIAC
jgi:cysteine desulfurase